jgi:hypothetical protein
MFYDLFLVCVCVGFVMCGCFGNMHTVHRMRFFINMTEVFLTLTEVFPCSFLSCKANARIKLAKTGHGPHSSTLFVICVVRLFALFCVLFVCKCVLPPGDNPIAVNKCINKNILLYFLSSTFVGQHNEYTKMHGMNNIL